MLELRSPCPAYCDQNSPGGGCPGSRPPQCCQAPPAPAPAGLSSAPVVPGCGRAHFISPELLIKMSQQEPNIVVPDLFQIVVVDVVAAPR